tara:strand:- start:143 stop:415 length:273 start_codon:yes stop_codon:yes gene_type:complete
MLVFSLLLGCGPNLWRNCQKHYDLLCECLDYCVTPEELEETCTMMEKNYTEDDIEVHDCHVRELRRTCDEASPVWEQETAQYCIEKFEQD